MGRVCGSGAMRPHPDILAMTPAESHAQCLTVSLSLFSTTVVQSGAPAPACRALDGPPYGKSELRAPSSTSGYAYANAHGKHYIANSIGGNILHAGAVVAR